MSEEMVEGTVPEVEMNPLAQETQSPVVVSVEDLVGSIADNDLVTGGKQLADLMAAKVDAALEAEKIAIADVAFNGVPEPEAPDGMVTDPDEVIDHDEEVVASEMEDTDASDDDLEISDEEIQAEVDAIFAEEDALEEVE
jgi:hypothetical protein